jgi:Smr domain
MGRTGARVRTVDPTRRRTQGKPVPRRARPSVCLPPPGRRLGSGGRFARDGQYSVMPRNRRSVEPGRNPFDALDGPVSAMLDLHGFTGSQAREAAAAFLQNEAQRRPGSLVHIVTGKGRGSTGPPVLLPRIRTLLRTGQLSCIAAWGLDLDGGGFLVRLR